MRLNPCYLGPFLLLCAMPLRAAVPGEATNLQWCSTKKCMQWSPAPGATQYTVYRGEEASTPCLVNTPLDSCLKGTFFSTTTGAAAISEVPPSKRFYWYLVTGKNGSGEGPSGKDRLNGVPLPRVRNTTGSCSASCGAAGSPCSVPSDCCSSRCGAGSCQSTCCGPEGSGCAADADCCSGPCVASQCAPCLAEGVTCSSSSACCSDHCTGGACAAPCSPPGEPCAAASDCCSGYCPSGTCQPCGAIGGSCVSIPCCTGFCSDGICTEAPVVCGDGVISGIEQCDDGNVASQDGCSSTCTVETTHTCSGSPSTCVPCPGGRANCNGDSADGCEVDTNTDVLNCGACESVCTGACFGGTCCKFSGFNCDAASECCTGNCVSGICCDGYGSLCGNPGTRCCPGLNCHFGECDHCRTPGQQCAVNYDCCSYVCQFGVCY